MPVCDISQWPTLRTSSPPPRWQGWFATRSPKRREPSPSDRGKGPHRSEPPGAVLPESALIPDVPFVGFADSARIAYPDKEVVNPSLIAAAAMLAGTGNPSMRPPILPPPVPRRRMAVSLADIKDSLANGAPVFVLLPPAPGCHFLLPSVANLAAAVCPGLLRAMDNRDNSSGMLGRMATNSEYDALRATFGLETVSDLVNNVTTASAAVVVGYHDSRRVFVVHDPTCGPAVEIDFDRFEDGWRMCGSAFGVRIPVPGEKPRPPDNQSRVAYRPRFPSEIAADAYRRCYGAAACGLPDRAERMISDSQSLTGISRGYRHLFHVERSAVLRSLGRLGDAVGEIERAVELSPDNPVAWALATRLRDERGGRGDKEAGERARSEMVRAINDHEGLRALGKFLPPEFWIPLLSTDRGWAGERG